MGKVLQCDTGTAHIMRKVLQCDTGTAHIMGKVLQCDTGSLRCEDRRWFEKKSVRENRLVSRDDDDDDGDKNNNNNLRLYIPHALLSHVSNVSNNRATRTFSKLFLNYPTTYL